MPLCVLERILDDPVHTLAGVDFNLICDLIRGSLLKHAAGIDVRAFSVFANNREVYLCHANPLQRTEPLVE